MSPCDNCTLMLLGDLLYAIHDARVRDRSAFRSMVRQRLTTEDRKGIAKLVAGIARGDVTEDLLRARWKNTAAGDQFVLTSLTDFAFEVARAIEEQP
ncbi:hypothetical protein OE766_28925 [Pararhizobium sp. YC-54]|uniref:hypothetical protein n=1 Tax=Pararhizobium sp. YC-54 TaxID=2986920 RepID=UPI0021F7A429|nr:hypothetical protein [Pararhizobium sp. YC-54]MCW0002223.1 hypothetical protein [Pararhizobium sp. YC-54]